MASLNQTAAAFMRETLARTERYSTAALVDYQRGHLQHLLSFAQAETPFYKERLAPLFRRNGTVDWSRWHEIPVLTRADVRSNGEAMLPKKLPAGHGRVQAMATSGTTGTPITVHYSTLMSVAGIAAFGRACRWYGFKEDDRLCIALGATRVAKLEEARKAAGKSPEDFKSSNCLTVSQHWSPERILSLMEQHGSVCISGMAAVMESVAAAQVERRFKINLKYLVGTGMAMTERGRTLTRQAFNARAFSAYSSNEGHMMANECPVSGGFHVNSELLLLEILDDQGKPCAPGETGRVVITPLLGTAQPLIRYEHGDLAAWGEPCSCGRAHPIIARIDGRVRNQFRFAEGNRFLPSVGHEIYRDFLKADRWQVAQTGSLDLEVRFISAAPDDVIDFGGMTQFFRKIFHSDLNVTYRRVEVMPLTAAGKFIDYVNEYENNNASG